MSDYIFDLDNTLLAASCHGDLVDGNTDFPIMKLAQALNGTHRLWFSTTRSVFETRAVSNWLYAAVGLYPEINILFRSAGDTRPSSYVKMDHYNTIVKEGADIELVFDSYVDTDNAWNARGLRVAQVSERKVNR